MFTADFGAGSSDWAPASLGPHRQQFLDDVAPLLEGWRNPFATLAFGGHFNSGKSTLLAALIGRDILPIGDIPETGVACRIRSGGADQVRAIDASGQSIGVPFDRNRITSVIAAYTHSGSRRSLAEMPHALDIEVSGAPIPEAAVWIDSPGINDTDEMSDRALEIGLSADMLIWVLNSRQCLSEPEIRFLAQFVEKRGQAALAFVLNVFLYEDTDAAWQQFSERELPILHRRLRDNAGDFGMDGERIELRAVSARAMLKEGAGKFGGQALARWLSELGAPGIPAIRQSRLRRCEIASSDLAANLAPAIEAAEADLSAREAAIETHAGIVKRRGEFVARANTAITTALKHFESNAEAAADEVADSVRSGAMRSAGAYEEELGEALEALRPGSDLHDRLESIAGQYGLGPAPKNAEAELNRLLAIEPLSVTVYDTPIKKRKIGMGALIAGVGLAPFTGGVSLVAAGLGAAAGGVMAASDAAEKDVALTRASIREAGSNEGRRVRKMGDTVAQLVERKWLGPNPAPPPPADRESLEALLALRDSYRAFPTRLAGACPPSAPMAQI